MWRLLVLVPILFPTLADAQVTELIADFSHGSYVGRDNAELRLKEIGEPARKDLENALANGDAETKIRARLVLRFLNEAAMWRPTILDVPSGLTISDVMPIISKQSGIKICLGDQYQGFEDVIMNTSMPIGELPKEFWPAIDAICNATGNMTRPNYNVELPGLVVVAGSQGRHPVAYSGPIKASITSMRTAFSEDLDFQNGKPDISHTFTVNLQMEWEDKLKLVAYRPQVELVSADTDVGTKLLSTQPAAVGWNVTGSNTKRLIMNIRLHPPGVAAKKLDKFVIKWGLLAVGDMSVIRLDCSSRDVVYKDDVEISIVDFGAKSAKRYSLEILVKRDRLVSDPSEAAYNEFEIDLVDAAGVAFKRSGQTNELADGVIKTILTFDGNGESASPKYVLYKYPRIRSRRDVELTFKDVVIPHSWPK